MSSHYVYVIVNKINLKLYFGSHSWEGTGLDKNYYGSGKLIKRAVKKYGKENFIIQPIKFFDNVEECRRAEEELLTKYDISNNPYCYNIKNAAVGWTSEDMTGENNPMYGKRGKDSPLYGKHLSEEHRKNLSEAHKGKTLSDEHRKKLSQAKKGKTLSDEHKQKIAQALKGENNPLYGKRGENHPLYGKHLSEEHRKNLSQAHKGLKHSDATRQKMTQSKENIMTPVVAIDKNGKVKIFKSQRECSRVLGVNYGNINSCLKGRKKQAGGYTFKYIEQLESGIYEGITEGIV